LDVVVEAIRQPIEVVQAVKAVSDHQVLVGSGHDGTETVCGGGGSEGLEVSAVGTGRCAGVDNDFACGGDRVANR